MTVACEASNIIINTKSRFSKIPCEICRLLFDTEDIMEEHKKLKYVEHKRPSDVGCFNEK